MSQNRQQLLSDALELPVDERGRLAALLIESLDSGTDENAAEAWSIEIDQRLHDIDRGQVRMVPWPEARTLIRGQDGTVTD